MSSRLTNAFSLIELSIVLVILGLLTGGILSGQSLIRAAELRSVVSDTSRYLAALTSFRDKYFALPGDMTNATSFWGTLNATAATCITTAATGTATCNGNGDGQIFTTDSSHYDESFRMWQHMANAGLIEGSYSGISGTTANSNGTFTESFPGINVPRTRISSGGYFIAYFNITASDPNLFPVQGNVLEIGAAQVGNTPSGLLFKPDEAWNLDTKLDDGLPAQGRVMAAKNEVPNCVSSATQSSAVYVLSGTSIACSLYINTGL